MEDEKKLNRDAIIEIRKIILIILLNEIFALIVSASNELNYTMLKSNHRKYSII